MRAVQADAPASVPDALMLRSLLDGAQVRAIDFWSSDGDCARDRAWWWQRNGVALAELRWHVGLQLLAGQQFGRASAPVQSRRPREISHLRASGEPYRAAAFAVMTQAGAR